MCINWINWHLCRFLFFLSMWLDLNFVWFWQIDGITRIWLCITYDLKRKAFILTRQFPKRYNLLRGISISTVYIICVHRGLVFSMLSLCIIFMFLQISSFHIAKKNKYPWMLRPYVCVCVYEKQIQSSYHLIGMLVHLWNVSDCLHLICDGLEGVGVCVIHF